MVAVDGRTVARRHRGGIDQIFDPDRDAVQRLRPRDPVEGRRPAARIALFDMAPRANLGLARGNARKTGGNQRRRIKFARIARIAHFEGPEHFGVRRQMGFCHLACIIASQDPGSSGTGGCRVQASAVSSSA